MYNDMYETYSDICLNYEYPISFECRNRTYLYLNDPVKVKWYFGDEVPLKFNILDRDDTDEETVPEYLQNKIINIKFYNFRKELIYETEFHDTDIQYDEENYYVELVIDTPTSEEIFKRGIYYCGAKLIDEDENQETILYYENCSIMVM